MHSGKAVLEQQQMPQVCSHGLAFLTFCHMASGYKQQESVQTTS